MKQAGREKQQIFRHFRDREEAGQALARALSAYAGRKNVLLLALPRGGVPVADAVARELSLPMDVWLVRKLGVPGHEEMAMGAVSMGGICHIDPNVVARLDIPDAELHETIARERLELDRRNRIYRRDRPPPHLRDKTVIVIDDGLATGASVHAAVLSLRAAHAQRIVVAVPVGSAAACDAIGNIADEVVCVHTPEPFYGVSGWYADFSQVGDGEVLELLNPKNEART